MSFSKEDQLFYSKKNKDILQQDKVWATNITLKRQCEYCLARNTKFDAHHIISRSNKKVRHDPDNGCCLCHKCHMEIAHAQPDRFRQFLIETRGKVWWDELNRKAYVN